MVHSNIRAVIFDMDGVITDTEPLHMEAELLTCADHGIVAPIEMWEGFRGHTTLDIFETIVARCCPGQHDPAALAEYKVRTYLRIAPARMTVFPGVLDFIAACAVKYTLALTTSSRVEIQREAFRRFGLAPHFTVITTGDEVTHGKPHPEPYQLTVARLGLVAGECAVIEDSDAGIRSAASAGCIPLGITNSFPSETLHAAGAAFVASTYDQLATHLGL